MKRLIFPTLMMTIALAGCGDSITKIVETKEGTYLLNALGDIKKLEGDKLTPVKNAGTGATSSSVLTASEVISGKKFDLKFTIKAKLLDDSTLYKIYLELPPGDRNKDRELFFAPNSQFRTAQDFDGVSSIDITFIDEDGFELGADTFRLNRASWSKILGPNGDVEKFGLDEIRSSSKLRGSHATSIGVLWRGGKE